MDLTLKQKVRLACDKSGITMTEIGEKMGTSQQNFSKRVVKGKFTQEEMQQIAEILGAKWYSGFEFPDGTKIE